MKRSIPLARLAGMASAAQGLTQAQAAARRQQFGENRIVETPRTNWRALLGATLMDPMLWFLLVASGLFYVVGEHTEAMVLLLSLIPFLGMDAFLHRRTQASIAGLSGRLASTARVLREDATQTLAATELVPGDLVLVNVGEAVPADGVWVSTDTLQVDESALTGEAYPVRKQPLAELPRHDDEARMEDVHWGFAGTRALAGQGRLRVVFTGKETLYGEIVASAVRGSQERTPLQRAVANLVAVLVVAAAVICALLAWVRYQQGHGFMDAILSALTLAVAALPEEFPVALTFFLGVGVYRLARRQALVRRGVVVENIGRVSCICSDKTGTLTGGQLRLTHRYPADGLDEARLLGIAAAAARLESGDALDMAILDNTPAWEEDRLVQCFPFTEDRKRETSLYRQGHGLLAAVKGAPEVVLGLCALSPEQGAAWQDQTERLAQSGHKVIACAWRDMPADGWAGGEPDRGFRLAGLLAFEDPVRDGVAKSIRACRQAHIQVIMVTGDHPDTAAAVAREIGLGGAAPRVIEGEAMQARIGTEGGAFLRQVDVIARAIPAQKLTLVRTLQARGEIVALTGDGVNDVPALQAADIGIAMGGRGTRSAREIADIVLLDDNFRSIVRAIAEGRQLFANLQLSFQYLLMIHIPLVISAAAIPLAGYPLLYQPIHVVWLEMIIHPTALLVFQGLPAGDALAPLLPRRQMRFFDTWQWLTILLVGGLLTLTVMGSYVRSLGAGLDTEHARAMALLMLAMASAGITAALSRLHGLAAKAVVAATLSSAILLVQVPWLAALLHLRPLHLDDWAVAAAGGLLAALLSMLNSLRNRATR